MHTDTDVSELDSTVKGTSRTARQRRNRDTEYNAQSIRHHKKDFYERRYYRAAVEQKLDGEY